LKTAVLPLRPLPVGAFGVIRQDRRRTTVKETVPSEQAVTRIEHPLPARVQEALGELAADPRRAFWEDVPLVVELRRRSLAVTTQ